jgi:hypothetical protein
MNINPLTAGVAQKAKSVKRKRIFQLFAGNFVTFQAK